jgi:hypothetical protein
MYWHNNSKEVGEKKILTKPSNKEALIKYTVSKKGL